MSDFLNIGYAKVFNDLSTASKASNVKSGINPPFVLSDFYAIYPQFQNLTQLPEVVVEMYAQFAYDCVEFDRWANQWKMGMSLFIAHFCTIYLQSTTNGIASAQQVLAAGQSKGLMTSKGVGDVSVSYDFSSAITGVERWGQFTTTAFGLQFASIAKLLAKGGMWVR